MYNTVFDVNMFVETLISFRFHLGSIFKLYEKVFHCNLKMLPGWKQSFIKALMKILHRK